MHNHNLHLLKLDKEAKYYFYLLSQHAHGYFSMINTKTLAVNNSKSCIDYIFLANQTVFTSFLILLFQRLLGNCFLALFFLSRSLCIDWHYACQVAKCVNILLSFKFSYFLTITLVLFVSFCIPIGHSFNH